jgi:hypothetical protein
MCTWQSEPGEPLLVHRVDAEERDSSKRGVVIARHALYIPQDLPEFFAPSGPQVFPDSHEFWLRPHFPTFFGEAK